MDVDSAGKRAVYVSRDDFAKRQRILVADGLVTVDKLRKATARARRPLDVLKWAWEDMKQAMLEAADRGADCLLLQLDADVSERHLMKHPTVRRLQDEGFEVKLQFRYDAAGSHGGMQCVLKVSWRQEEESDADGQDDESDEDDADEE